MPRVGEEFGHYRLGPVLGQGGMGLVFQAENLRLGNVVALKILSPQLANDDIFRTRFLREAQIAARFSHPNVVPIIDYDAYDGLLYIAMRYVAGTNLRQMIEERGWLDPDTAVHLLSQAALALDAAHRRGLVHRDVKPANLLVERTSDDADPDHLYLADFGITKYVGGVAGLTGPTMGGIVVGTAPYIAPEQAQDLAVGGATDQYALGCVLYECLTGRMPFVKDSIHAVMRAHVEEAPPRATLLRPELPPAIDEVFAQVLAKYPDQRYPSCRAFMAAVGEALGMPARPTGEALGMPGRPTGGGRSHESPPAAPPSRGSGEVVGDPAERWRQATQSMEVPAMEPLPGAWQYADGRLFPAEPQQAAEPYLAAPPYQAAEAHQAGEACQPTEASPAAEAYRAAEASPAAAAGQARESHQGAEPHRDYGPHRHSGPHRDNGPHRNSGARRDSGAHRDAAGKPPGAEEWSFYPADGEGRTARRRRTRPHRNSPTWRSPVTVGSGVVIIAVAVVLGVVLTRQPGTPRTLGRQADTSTSPSPSRPPSELFSVLAKTAAAHPGDLNMLTCQQTDPTLVKCTHPAAAIASITFETFTSESALYAHYQDIVKNLTGQPFTDVENWNVCGQAAPGPTAESSWNQSGQYPTAYSVQQLASGAVPTDTAAGRMFCTQTKGGGSQYIVWTQNSGTLLGYATGAGSYAQVWNWFLAIHLDISLPVQPGAASTLATPSGTVTATGAAAATGTPTATATAATVTTKATAAATGTATAAATTTTTTTTEAGAATRAGAAATGAGTVAAGPPTPSEGASSPQGIQAANG